MKTTISFLFLFLTLTAFSQDEYDKARKFFDENKLDFARYYINQALKQNPTVEEYFLSAMIYEAEGKELRAIADYEAVVQIDPTNLEAYFQKGLIYYNSSSLDQAIGDFTSVIDNYQGSETNAIYFANDPFGKKGTFLTTLQSMLGRVYQYRGLAYSKKGDNEKAIQDFTKSFDYDTLSDFYINRARVYGDMGKKNFAIKDLNDAIRLEPDNYVALYNLALIDETTELPEEMVNDQEFAPVMNLLGTRAFQKEEYAKAASYFTGAIKNDPEDPLAYINRGKVFIRTKKYPQARADFLKAIQNDARSVEAFYLVGNTFFYEQKFEDAIGFYERYLAADRGLANVWYNTAMANLSLKQTDRACECLSEASKLGMQQASDALGKFCESE